MKQTGQALSFIFLKDLLFSSVFLLLYTNFMLCLFVHMLPRVKSLP
jgi:hypothetical protein